MNDGGASGAGGPSDASLLLFGESRTVHGLIFTKLVVQLIEENSS